MKKLKNILQLKYILFLIVIIFSLLRRDGNLISKYSINDKNFYGIILDYKYNDSYITFTLKGKELLKCNYYLNENEFIKINYGDKVYLTGNLKEPSNNTIPNTFNYKKYLNDNNIKYILEINKINILKNNTKILFKIKNAIQNRINKLDKKGYLNAFILGNKNYINELTYNAYQDNGILHIFSISGMHISILASIILFLLNKIKKSDKNIIVVIIFLYFYMILTNYQASIVRSVVFYITLKIFKIIKIKIETKDALLLAISIILLIKPKFIYNIGFLYSSIISYSLIKYSSLFNKNYFINTLLISLVSFVISLPITVNSNYNINLLSILINLIFVPIVTFILYPLSLLTFFFPIFSNAFNYTINITELLSNILSSINLFNISIPKLNILNIVIYYILVYLILNKDKKYILILIIFILFIKNYNIFDKSYYVYFLDVGQGDMALIKYKDEAVVIDTGNIPYNKNYNYMDNILTFFKSIGVNSIDSLILTHGDNDHVGNASYLVDTLKVEKVIFNCGELNNLEQDLIKVLDKKKISYYSCIKDLNIDNNKLYFLNNKDYGNENDNSSVVYTKFNNHKFLFMGDAGIEVENDLIEKYNLHDIDVLKVGHHGSKTSSSRDFIDNINPKFSVISVGKNNRYGHPNKEVINVLKNSKIYRTDKDGSIMFKVEKNRMNIETCQP